MAEDEQEPIETPEEGEDPKEVAKTMLIEGFDRDSIIDDIQETTGLPKRTIWAIKGALARSGDIPTKAQINKMEREKPGPEAQKFKEEAEGVPFRRPRPPYVLIESILTQFGVKERAKEIIISRCKRAGGMHPSELERALIDLDTGVNNKEASYITEEYYIALQGEEQASRDTGGRAWVMQRNESRYGGTYGGAYTQRDQYPSTGYNRDLERRSWDTRYETRREDPLTMQSLMDILEKRERDLEDRMTKRGLEDKIGELSGDISVIATELKNMKENPPAKQTQPQGPSEYEKALQHTIDRQDKRHEELMEMIKSERTEAKEDVQYLRDTYEKQLEKREREYKDELSKKGTPHDTSDYSDDSVRLAAEGLHEVADVMRTRGSPVKIMIEGLPRIMGEEVKPPPRERGQPASVADLVGPEYVERT